MANLPLCTHRYFMMVSYMGTKYNGSQRLVGRDTAGKQDTIQEALEVALETAFVKKRCRLTSASRTDKGVHALMNCFTLPLMDFALPTSKFKRLVNEKLLKDRHEIIVNEVLLVPADLHPRKAAKSREYIYRIGVPRASSGFPMNRSNDLFQFFPASELYRILPVAYLDLEKFEAAANVLRGVHDFRSFCLRPLETDDTLRDLEIDVVPSSDASFGLERSQPFNIYNVRFKSRAFLHNQVRRMIGTMLSHAAFGTAELSDIQRLLDEPSADSWSSKFMIAEPWGLYLTRLNYDKSSFAGSIRTYEDVNDQETVNLDDLLEVAADTQEESSARRGDHGDCTTTTKEL